MGIKRLLKDFFVGNQTSEHIWNIRQKAQCSPRFIRYIYIYIYQKYLIKYNSFFPLSTKVSSMPIFPHGLNGIFISQGAELGKDCVIFHQVTIGSNTLVDSKGQGAPTIGDNVYIGAGAKIIGKVTIGNNVRIGANCVVTKDVPDNTTVVSAPIRFIEKTEKMNNIFVKY